MKIRSAAALVLAAGFALAGCSGGASTGDGASTRASGSATAESSAPASDLNDADVMFATMMISHHEQAIEMSDMLLAKDDVDGEVRKLAEGIKAAQDPEIEQMQEWLDSWGVEPDGGHSDHEGHGDGMMSDDDVSALQSASGPAASKLFLEQMIVHHEGAVEMAQSEVVEGQNADAVILAQRIVNAQNGEIQQMRDMLDGLK